MRATLKNREGAHLNARKLGNLMIVLGVGLVCYTACSQAYYAYVGYTMAKDLEAQVMADLADLEPESVVTDASEQSSSEDLSSESSADAPGSSEESTSGDTQEASPAQTGPVSLGDMEIPKIEMTATVLEGTESTQLAAGIGHVTGSALPGEAGNCCVAGHRSGRAAKPFEHLDELTNGDLVRFVVGDSSYEYEVFDKFVVEPTDVWVLKQNKDESIVTVITCEYVSVGVKKRLIVRARLIEP